QAARPRRLNRKPLVANRQRREKTFRAAAKETGAATGAARPSAEGKCVSRVRKMNCGKVENWSCEAERQTVATKYFPHPPTLPARAGPVRMPRAPGGAGTGSGRIGQ